VDVVLLYSHTVSTISGHRQSSACAVVVLPLRPVKQGKFVLKPSYPPPFPVVVETINPTAATPLSCGDHRSRDLGAVLVVDSMESTTHGVNLVVFPSRLPPTKFLIACHPPPTFWSSASLYCVVSLPPPQKQKHTYKCVPPICFTNTSSP